MKNDNEIVDWMTVKGNHIPIRKGQTREQAMLTYLSEVEDNEPFREKATPQNLTRFMALPIKREKTPKTINSTQKKWDSKIKMSTNKKQFSFGKKAKARSIKENGVEILRNTIRKPRDTSL